MNVFWAANAARLGRFLKGHQEYLGSRLSHQSSANELAVFVCVCVCPFGSNDRFWLLAGGSAAEDWRTKIIYRLREHLPDGLGGASSKRATHLRTLFGLVERDPDAPWSLVSGGALELLAGGSIP